DAAHGAGCELGHDRTAAFPHLRGPSRAGPEGPHGRGLGHQDPHRHLRRDPGGPRRPLGGRRQPLQRHHGLLPRPRVEPDAGHRRPVPAGQSVAADHPQLRPRGRRVDRDRDRRLQAAQRPRPV
ncbi:MAG: hypothetical protein AVDCRST_MAG54-100, partial [uncultured Actinomycetospora sp.]